MPDPDGRSAPPGANAVERVWGAVGTGAREALERGLSTTDLQTLLLDVARTRASSVSASTLARRWAEDRFVRPSSVDPREVMRLEHGLWTALPSSFVGVDLSPVAPLGTCAAVAPVDQNRILTTARMSEVVSDPTNVLALEAAARRRHATPREEVHLATSHRVLRTQRFEPGMSQHFRLFALVSSARDRGSGSTETSLLLAHLRFWCHALAAACPGRAVTIEVSALGDPLIEDRLADSVLPALVPPPNVALRADPERQRARGYYVGGALRVEVAGDEGPLEVGDGGLTDWTAQLLHDAKERCLVSCVSTERLAMLDTRART